MQSLRREQRGSALTLTGTQFKMSRPQHGDGIDPRIVLSLVRKHEASRYWVNSVTRLRGRAQLTALPEATSAYLPM